MTISIPETDWKYLRKIKAGMLATLCGKINEQSKKILNTEDRSEHEKYLELYEHIKQSDRIIADCFNDWKRSNIWLKIQYLQKHGLLTDQLLNGMLGQHRAILETLSRIK